MFFDSVLIHGVVDTVNYRGFGTKFAQLTGDLMGTRVEASEVMAILGQSNYFRVKVMDENIRKQLLDKAKHLKRFCSPACLCVPGSHLCQED